MCAAVAPHYGWGASARCMEGEGVAPLLTPPLDFFYPGSRSQKGPSGALG